MAAGQGFKTFTTGEVLTAGDVNGYLMQGINVFTNATARDAAITAPAEGQFAFTKDNNSLWYYDGAAWVASGATGDIEGVTAGVGISGGGTSGTVTVTNSMATAIDAKGDLVPGTGADTFARLAVGTNGQVLTADSTAATGLAWTTVSAGSTGPAFRAFRSGSNQSIASSTSVKVQLNAETFDTNNCFDSTTNYRFTPTTAGYYLITANIAILSGGAGYAAAYIYKNGSRTSASRVGPYASNSKTAQCTDIVYCNGSTDYIELYTLNDGSTASVAEASDETWLTGAFIHS